MPAGVVPVQSYDYRYRQARREEVQRRRYWAERREARRRKLAIGFVVRRFRFHQLAVEILDIDVPGHEAIGGGFHLVPVAR